MNNKLWTGESVFCICGHHVEHHTTSQKLRGFSELDRKFDEEFPDLHPKCRFIVPTLDNGYQECVCKEFQAYKK